LRQLRRHRVLNANEETALLAAYPAWLERIAVVARETCLSEGDIIRLTKPMIDRERREIVPAGGRVKTAVEQRAPLTERVLEVLDDIERQKRRGAIVANVNGLLFTRDDGRAITKDMIRRPSESRESIPALLIFDSMTIDIAPRPRGRVRAFTSTWR
jgi:integrase